jgi:hypothetical protein
VTAMSDALGRCDRIVAPFAAAYFDRRRYTTEEWITALLHVPGRETGRPAPVRVEEAPLADGGRPGTWPGPGPADLERSRALGEDHPGARSAASNLAADLRLLGWRAAGHEAARSCRRATWPGSHRETGRKQVGTPCTIRPRWVRSFHRGFPALVTDAPRTEWIRGALSRRPASQLWWYMSGLV